MAHIRKPPANGPSIDWGPWATVRFPSEIARDEFVCSVASRQDAGWGAEVLAGDQLGAQVRWRPGRFLRLNDVAYAHGGRIVVAVGHFGIV
jgi:hypothetical protein